MNKTREICCALVCAALLDVPELTAQDFVSLNLKQAVDMALRNSREVALAQARYNVAQNTVEVNRSAFRPNLFTGSGAAYTYGFPQTPGGAAPSIVNASYVQTVFNPLLAAQTRAASERMEAQRLELEKTRNLVMLQTSSAYLELAKVRHSLDLMRTQRQSNGRIRDFTRQRLNEGLELPIEVTRAELNEARSEQRIVQLESRQRVLERQLAALIGVPAGQRIEIESEVLPFEEQQREQDLVDRALKSSLDLQQAELERRAREHRLQGEIGTKWPAVDLFAEYGLFARFNNFQDFFQRFQRNNFNIGLQVRIPIVSAQRSANVNLAKSELTTAEMELKSKRQNVELDVERQYQHLRELNAAREVERLELKLAQENLQIVQASFEEGRSNLRDVEKARLEENDKWLAFLDSDYEYQKAHLDLLNTTGDLGRLFR
ncbi:MAG TPA: TolC family protein [Terriglobia bacterium]|nr:TolC family protein [Terriglobia bacterium]